MSDFGTLFAKLRSDIPKEAFRPQPLRGWIVLITTLSLIVGVTWLLIHYHPHWYLALAGGLLIGCAYNTLAFLAHDTLHGSTFRSKRMQDAVGILAFAIFGFTGTLWKVWHNKVHHTKTNIPDVDPDSYGTLERFKHMPMAKFQFKTGVGSGSWLTAFFFLYRFTYHSQIVLWVISKKYPQEFKDLNRGRAMAESFLLLAFWVGLGIAFGPWGGLFAIVIPMMVANFIMMSYIATNHFLRPLVENYNPIEDSMSVTSWKWVDVLHLNFSHHIEHHYFPSMNWRFTPLVRASLLKHAPDRYLAPPHWKAVWMLYKTPRLYEDAETLINPYTGKKVKIREVEKQLKEYQEKYELRHHPFHQHA